MTAPLPLEGVRIVDMSWMWAGPYATLQLAHLGAEVIRIETHQRPCMNRRVPPYAGEPGLNRGGSFNQWNQGKRSVLLDLKRPEGVELARELAAASDVFVENYSVGVVDRLGLGWEALSALNSRLVMISLSGYGLTGPYRDRVAFGGPLTMISGLASLTGYEGHGPSEVGLSYGDPNAALHGAFAIMAALWQREESGAGQHIDLSQWESLIAILPEGVMAQTLRGDVPARRGNHDGLMSPHGLFPCAGEDRWLSIAVRDDAEWDRLAGLIGDDALEERYASAAGRKQHEADLDAMLGAWTQPQDRWAVAEQLQALGIAAVPVFDMADVGDDPHMNERGFFVELEHAEIGRMKHAGIPWQLHGTPLQIERAAPCMGEDNAYVVQELLGRSEMEFQRLLDEGVLY